MYAGKDMPTVEMRIVNNELIVGKAERHTVYVNDVDIAIHRLLLGETVHVFQGAAIVSQVQRTVNMVLGAKAVDNKGA